MLFDTDDERRGSQIQKKSKSFGLQMLIRWVHLDQAQHILPKRFTGRKA
jgi:hypothetical protein